MRVDLGLFVTVYLLDAGLRVGLHLFEVLHDKSHIVEREGDKRY